MGSAAARFAIMIIIMRGMVWRLLLAFRAMVEFASLSGPVEIHWRKM
jgi:hypothetical protein